MHFELGLGLQNFKVYASKGPEISLRSPNTKPA